MFSKKKRTHAVTYEFDCCAAAAVAAGGSALVAPRSQGASVSPTKINDKISSKSNNSNGSSSNSNNNSNNCSSGNTISNSSNVVVSRAATPAATKGRLSFGPVPKERFSMESGLLSFSSDALSPSSPGDGRSSLGSASRHHPQGETAADERSSNNRSDSSSCVMMDVDGIDTETTDNLANFEHDLLNSSVASIDIEVAGLLPVDGASLSLPPL